MTEEFVKTEEEREQCGSVFGGKLAPVGFGVRCELPANHPGLHRGGGGAWITRELAKHRRQ